jgi:hypothetical protein
MMPEGVVVKQVEYHDLPEVWDTIEPLYEEVIVNGYAVPQLSSYIPIFQRGHAQLWIGKLGEEIVGMMITELVDLPSGRIARILALASHAMRDLKAYQTTFELWASVNGAGALEAICSDKLLAVHARYGFEKVANVIRKGLGKEMH